VEEVCLSTHLFARKRNMADELLKKKEEEENKLISYVSQL